MLPKAKFTAAAMFGAAILIVVEMAAWWVQAPEPFRAGFRDWQSANPAECSMLALALGEMETGKPSNPIPLAATNSGRGSCERTLGFNRPIVTYAQINAADAAESAGKGRYIEHFRLSRPNYSALHVRAVVTVAYVYGNVGADGYACWLHLGLRGWQVEGCRRKWIS